MSALGFCKILSITNIDTDIQDIARRVKTQKLLLLNRIKFMSNINCRHVLDNSIVLCNKNSIRFISGFDSNSKPSLYSVPRSLDNQKGDIYFR